MLEGGWKWCIGIITSFSFPNFPLRVYHSSYSMILNYRREFDSGTKINCVRTEIRGPGVGTSLEGGLNRLPSLTPESIEENKNYDGSDVTSLTNRRQT